MTSKQADKMSTHQPPTPVENPEGFEETISIGYTCPRCKKETLRESVHLGKVSEKCLNKHCNYQFMHTR